MTTTTTPTTTTGRNTGAPRPWIEFREPRTSADGNRRSVAVILDGEPQGENGLVQNLDEEADPMRGVRWYTEFEAWYVGAAAGASWPTLDEAKTALMRALGAIPETSRRGLSYSPPIPRNGLRGPTIRIFLDGIAMDATIEHLEDPEPARPWHVEPNGDRRLKPAAGPHRTLADARDAIRKTLRIPG